MTEPPRCPHPWFYYQEMGNITCFPCKVLCWVADIQMKMHSESGFALSIHWLNNTLNIRGVSTLSQEILAGQEFILLKNQIKRRPITEGLKEEEILLAQRIENRKIKRCWKLKGVYCNINIYLVRSKCISILWSFLQ